MHKSLVYHNALLVVQRIAKPTSVILLLAMLCLVGCVAPVIEEAPPDEIELPAETKAVRNRSRLDNPYGLQA